MTACLSSGLGGIALKLNQAQFDALAKLMRMRNSPTKEAVREVLMEDKTAVETAKKHNLNYNAVRRTANYAYECIALVHQVVTGVEKAKPKRFLDKDYKD